MGDFDIVILIGIMLLLIATGVMALFNLGVHITPALDTSFGGTWINIAWTILLRVIVAPLMIIVPSWVIINVIRG